MTCFKMYQPVSVLVVMVQKLFILATRKIDLECHSSSSYNMPCGLGIGMSSTLDGSCRNQKQQLGSGVGDAHSEDGPAGLSNV